MMALCLPTAPDAGFLRAMIDFVDCQAATLGARGYQALAAPGSSLSLLITGLLVLFVALFGYRMLFGHTPSIRDGVLALVKIGIVLALATSWPAYRTLVYDVALRGPAEVTGEVGGASAIPGATGGLVDRLDYADRAFVALEIAGPGPIIYGAPPSTGQSVAPPLIPGFDVLALGSARLLFLVGAIGALALVRLVAGLLLALGPFFFAFLLFDGTRGWFEGWARILGAAVLGALGTAVALGIELSLLEPWLADLLARRAANLPIPGVPTQLLAATLIFDLVLLGLLVALARVAMGFRLPPVWRSAPAQLLAAVRGGEAQAPVFAREGGAAPAADRSRAAFVADAVAASQRRESAAAQAAAAAAAAAAGAPARGTPRHILERDIAPPAPVPIGQSFRRTRTRVSPGAGRRDRTS